MLAADNTARLCGRCLKEHTDQLSAPPELQNGFFETDDFLAAFASRHIGKVFKAYRNHPRHLKMYGKALNQELLGRWLGLNQGQVSRLEKAPKADLTIETLQNYALILHLPQHLLWFDLPGQSRLSVREADSKRRAGLVAARKAAGLTQEDLAYKLNVDRATIGRWEAGERAPLPYMRPKLARLLGRSPQQLEDLIKPPNRDSRAVEPQAEQVPSISPESALGRREFMLVTSGTVLSMTESLHRGLSSRAGKSDLEYLLSRTARLRRLDNYLGGRDTYNLYVSELASTIGYIQSVSCGPNIRKALTGIVAEQAQLAGWAAFDAGMHVEAKKHYGDSLEAAKEANDPALMGNALAFLAYQEVSTIGPNVGLAEASFAAAEKEATPRVRALLLERKAWTYAVAGDYQATVKALADAKAALRTESDLPEPDWVFWVDDNEIDIMTGRCLTELRHPLSAVSALDAALSRFDDTYARDKALYMTFLANALIDGDEIERAATVTAKSIELAQGVGSVRPSARITGVMHKLREFKDLESVSQLFEQVRA